MSLPVGDPALYYLTSEPLGQKSLLGDIMGMAK